jgi:hypothetical protein
VFVLNRSGDEATVPATGTDLLSDTTCNATVTVAPGAAAVVREGT